MVGCSAAARDWRAMTVEQFATQARHLRKFIGETCVRARCGYASALLLDFGMLHSPDQSGYQQPDKGLTIECCYRLETGKEVVFGWADQDDLIESRIGVLVGKCIERVKIFKPSYMAHIRFSEDLRLWIFPDQWKDYDPERAEYFVSWFVSGRAIPD